MNVSANGSRLVGRRFRRASWIFGFISLATFAYIGAYVEAVLVGVGFWGAFRLAAFAVERKAEAK